MTGPGGAAPARSWATLGLDHAAMLPAQLCWAGSFRF